jgi:hypothetical protein
MNGFILHQQWHRAGLIASLKPEGMLMITIFVEFHEVRFRQRRSTRIATPHMFAPNSYYYVNT